MSCPKLSYKPQNVSETNVKGLKMNGKAFTKRYRFGFNGMEADNEVSGDGNVYTTDHRELDVRLGRWFSNDPLERDYPWQSPYVAFDDDPINTTDPSGMGGENPNTTHTVKQGETLGEISKKTGQSIEAIKTENKQIDWTSSKRTGAKKDWIYAGEKLNIPGSNGKSTQENNSKSGDAPNGPINAGQGPKPLERDGPSYTNPNADAKVTKSSEIGFLTYVLVADAAVTSAGGMSMEVTFTASRFVAKRIPVIGQIIVAAEVIYTLNQLNYEVPPKTLPGFPNAKRVHSKNQRVRWLDGEDILEWDYRHGKVEKYNKRGKHKGEFDPDTGKQTKLPNPEYETEP